MPLYEYQCDACGHRFEVIQKYADAPIAVCPTCGGPVTKLFSSPAIQFKGSGFYLTDYGRSGKDTGKPGSGAEGGSAASGSSDKKGDGAGESKSASPSESTGGTKAETSPAKPAAKPDAKPSGGSTPAASGSSKD